MIFRGVSKVHWPAGTRVRVYPDKVGKRFRLGVLVTDLLPGATRVEVRIGRRVVAAEAGKLFLAYEDS